MPQPSLSKLLRFPSQISLFRFADLERAVSKELRVPFGDTEFPWNFCAAKLTLALVPASIHRPIPGEWCAVFAEEHRLYALSCPMFKPVGKFLNGHKVRIEINWMHGAQVSRRVVVNNAAGV